MEWIIPFLLGFLVVSAIIQMFWAYALSTIAQKGGQSELMQVLAWIPLLQIAPMIVAGGGSVGAFVLGTIGLIVGAVVLGAASAFLGGSVGGAIGGLCALFAGILVVVYFGRLCWTMAVKRDLSGWVGLLLFVPIVNFFVYPYIAFHDGWTSPNKIGLVIGLVLTVGSTAPSFKTLQALNGEGGLPPELALLMAGGLDLESLEGMSAIEGFEASEIESMPMMNDTNIDGEAIDPIASIRILYTMQERFERLHRLVDSPDITKPQQKQAATDLVRSIDMELRAHRGSLDAQTYQQLSMELVETEARIHATEGETGNWISHAATARSTLEMDGSPSPASMDSFSEPTPAPLRPFPVQAANDCPDGTQLHTRPNQNGEEEWCQQLEEFGGLRHGWYARYLAGGEPESMGEYSNGLRIGVWTRFYPSGRIRAQAQFAEGMQHGWMLSFDEEGNRTSSKRFDQGSVAR